MSATSVELFQLIMESRQTEFETRNSRRERYNARNKKRIKERIKEIRTEDTGSFEWDVEDFIEPPKKKSKKKKRSKLNNSQAATDANNASNTREVEVVVEMSKEEKLQALRERLATNPLVHFPVKPPPGHLQGRFPSDYAEKKAQQAEATKVRLEKKKLRREKEMAEKLEKAEAAKAAKQNNRKPTKKEVAAAKLTDPSLAPSAISLFTVDTIPSAPVAPAIPRRRPPKIIIEETDQLSEQLADISLQLPLDGLPDELPYIDVNDVLDYEQEIDNEAMLSNVDFGMDWIESINSSDDVHYEPMILDEEYGVLYEVDEEVLTTADTIEAIENTGITDSFLAMINNDDIKLDPVMAYNERNPCSSKSS